MVLLKKKEEKMKISYASLRIYASNKIKTPDLNRVKVKKIFPVLCNKQM